jgi:2,4-diaminopentanoate dehydrogenase
MTSLDHDRRPIKVIQWGVGYIGTFALKYILDNPDVELVGIKCGTEAKVGKTATELCRLPGPDVRATTDRDAILASDADCVIYMPRDNYLDPSISLAEPWFVDLLALLESGKNVVTSLTAGTHYRHLMHGERFRDRIEQACRTGHSTVLFTGFDPGFSDVLAITMTGAVGGISRVSTWEIVDYGDYPILDTLTAMGFGRRPDEIEGDPRAFVRATWGGVPYLMAEAVGLELDDLAVDGDFYLAPHTFTANGGLRVEAGTIGASRFSVSGLVAGEPRFTVEHVTRIGQDMAPDWPSIGRDGGYRVIVDAYPPFQADCPMGLPGGNGSTLADAMCMTSGRCVAVAASVVAARPGYLTFLDLPAVRGVRSRGLLAGGAR